LKRIIVDPETQVEWPIPAFSTETLTKARMENARNGNLLNVIVGPEHGLKYAVWVDDHALVDPEELGISAELANALRRWQSEWSTDQHSLRESSWVLEGERILQEMEALLWPIGIVERAF
jgi:hypothetical protein